MNKKTFALFLLVLIVGMGYSLSNIMERETSLSSEAPRSTIGTDAFRPMPKSSSQDYYFKEKAILQNLLTKGHTLDTYYAAFSTTRVTQADIDRRYDEYDEDMAIFETEVIKAKKAIAELNPYQEEAQAHQQDTLAKLDYLEDAVSAYSQHEVSANDTTAYLGECRQALARLFPQGKMEF